MPALILLHIHFIDDTETSITDKEELPVMDKGKNAIESTMADGHSPVFSKTDVFAIISSYGT